MPKPGRMTAEEYRAYLESGGAVAAQGKNKYGAVRTEVDGIWFDSKAEAGHFVALRFLLRDGKITDLIIHPQFTLQESFTRLDGEKVKRVWYTSDFQYVQDDVVVVEDVKGGKATQTRDFKIKINLFKKKYPDIKFRTVGG